MVLIQPFTRGSHDNFVTLDSITVIYRYHFCLSPNFVPYMFLGIMYIYSLIIVVLNIYLASNLRNINQRQFKNTKAVNILMVLVFMLGVINYSQQSADNMALI